MRPFCPDINVLIRFEYTITFLIFFNIHFRYWISENHPASNDWGRVLWLHAESRRRRSHTLRRRWGHGCVSQSPVIAYRGSAASRTTTGDDVAQSRQLCQVSFIFIWGIRLHLRGEHSPPFVVGGTHLQFIYYSVLYTDGISAFNITLVDISELWDDTDSWNPLWRGPVCTT